jgi:hypothetical protein
LSRMRTMTRSNVKFISGTRMVEGAAMCSNHVATVVL